MFRNKKLIEQKVLGHIRELIDRTQSSYEQELESVTKEQQETIISLHAQHAIVREGILDKHVDSIIGKLS